MGFSQSFLTFLVFLYFLAGDKGGLLWKQGSNRRKSPSPHRKAKMVSITQEGGLELSQVIPAFLREKKSSIIGIMLLPSGNWALRVYLGTEPQACITEPWPCHKGFLRMGEGAVRGAGWTTTPPPLFSPTEPCTFLGLLDFLLPTLLVHQRDLSQFSIRSIWNSDITWSPLSINYLNLKPTNFIALENLKLTLEIWLFSRKFYPQDFLCLQLQLLICFCLV